MRCAACGARNVDRAAWCTQCFATVGAEPTPERRVTSTAPTPERRGTGSEPTPERRGTGSEPTARADRAVRVRDDEVQWRCATCGGWVALQQDTCSTCGTARTGFGLEQRSPARAEVDVSTAIVASVALPGAGHLLVGRFGTGVARAVLAVVWLGGGIAAVRSGGGASGAVLLVGAAILWILTPFDAAAAAVGSPRQWLGGRRFAALVVSVTFALVVTVVLAALRAAS